MRRRLNRGDTVAHKSPAFSAWGKGIVKEVKFDADVGKNAFRVTFPDAKFDPSLICAYPGRVPPAEGIWFAAEELELVKRAPVQIKVLHGNEAASAAWENDQHTISGKEAALYEAPKGATIDEAVRGWTKCPMPFDHCSICNYTVKAELCAFHISRGNEMVTIYLCPHGVDLPSKCPTET